MNSPYGSYGYGYGESDSESKHRPATDKQREYASSLGIDLPPRCSVSKASDMITVFTQYHPTPSQIRLAQRRGVEFPPDTGVAAASAILAEAEKAYLDANPKILERRQKDAKRREAKRKADREAWEIEHAAELEIASEWERRADDDIYVAIAYVRGRAAKASVVRVIGPEIVGKGHVKVEFTLQKVKYDRDCDDYFVEESRDIKVRTDKIFWLEELGKLEIDDVRLYEMGLEAAETEAESYRWG